MIFSSCNGSTVLKDCMSCCDARREVYATMWRHHSARGMTCKQGLWVVHHTTWQCTTVVRRKLSRKPELATCCSQPSHIILAATAPKDQALHRSVTNHTMRLHCPTLFTLDSFSSTVS